MGSINKPFLLICASPIYGHVMPIRAIAKELVARGNDVTFITGSVYKAGIEAIGATHVSLEGSADITEADLPRLAPQRESITDIGERLIVDIEIFFMNTVPSQHATVQKTLQNFASQDPDRPIILMSEGFFFGSIPALLGVDIRPTATICLGIVPVVLSSVDTAPFGPGLPPDSSPEGRARNAAMNKGALEGPLAPLATRFAGILSDLGAPAGAAPNCPFVETPYRLADRFLQMCIPSVEYPRSDAPASLRFAGGLPRGHRDALANPPSWWGDLEGAAAAGKRVIAVSQGSVALNFSDLVIPTMEAVGGREDVLLVVALGRKGAELPAGVEVPANVRVADFIPFDDLLPYCAVFITNGGYGAFQHGLVNRTPLIVGGETEDKPEVAARAAWSGVGIDLKTGSPSAEQVRAAVDEVLNNGRYQKRSNELGDEMEQYDTMEVIQSTIDELANAK